MAKVGAGLRVKFKWWVRPFLMAGVIAAYPLAFAMSDDQIDDYCEALALIVAEHGVRLVIV